MTYPPHSTNVIVALDLATDALAAARFLPSEAQEGAEWAIYALEGVPEDIRACNAGCIAFARDTASALIADGLSPPPWNNREMLLRCEDLATALNAISAAIRPAAAQPMPSQSRRHQRKPRIPPPDALKTAAQAAAKLGCSVKTLNGHVDAGELRCITIGHGKKRPHPGSPTPRSTISLPTRPERTLLVPLQAQRRPLAVLPLRLPTARSSVSRLDEMHDAPRSRESRSGRA